MSVDPGVEPGPTRTAEEAVRQALSSGAAAAHARAPCPQPLTFGWRGMLKVKHVPEQLIDVTFTPVLFTLMFTYMFGGAIAGSTSDTSTFILPGHPGDVDAVHHRLLRRRAQHRVTKGVVDRFRSLPIRRPAPLVGAMFGDSVRYFLAATWCWSSASILGFRPDAGFAACWRRCCSWWCSRLASPG